MFPQPTCVIYAYRLIRVLCMCLRVCVCVCAGFFKMTGYTAAEILGHSLDMLYGKVVTTNSTPYTLHPKL